MRYPDPACVGRARDGHRPTVDALVSARRSARSGRRAWLAAGDLNPASHFRPVGRRGSFAGYESRDRWVLKKSFMSDGYGIPSRNHPIISIGLLDRPADRPDPLFGADGVARQPPAPMSRSGRGTMVARLLVSVKSDGVA